MKKTVDDLRDEYKQLTGKDSAVRWNRRTLEKKIIDFQILQAGYAAKERSASQPETGDVRPDFEALAGGSDKAEQLEIEEAPQERRGGYREGAGRPIGQTDRRAHCERVMSLEVPDLAVGLAVDTINSGLAQFTGVGLDDQPVSSIDLSKLPHGSRSMALGLTRLLYYWFPSLESRTDAVTLHLESLFLIFNPLRERAQRVYNLKKKEAENGKEENIETKNEPAQAPGRAAPGPAAPGRAAPGPAAPKRKKRKTKKTRRHGSHKR